MGIEEEVKEAGGYAMKVVMTSSIGGAIKENGKRQPAPLFWYNGFLEKLQSEWVDHSKIMMIAASPDDYEKMMKFVNA